MSSSRVLRIRWFLYIFVSAHLTSIYCSGCCCFSFFWALCFFVFHLFFFVFDLIHLLLSYRSLNMFVLNHQNKQHGRIFFINELQKIMMMHMEYEFVMRKANETKESKRTESESERLLFMTETTEYFQSFSVQTHTLTKDVRHFLCLFVVGLATRTYSISICDKHTFNMYRQPLKCISRIQ